MSPTLSVCCATGDPGPRVVAALEPLRGVADEIIVAADSRVDETTLGHYALIADRLFRIEFVDFVERALPWLHAQCSGDWILRIDSDEVVSPVLVQQLCRLIGQRDVVQYHLPRRWLFPDAGHWLYEWPWWPDYQNRLVRNDGLLWVPGLCHTVNRPELPARYLEEPFYHLDTALTTRRQRAKKVAYYRQLDPALREPASERYLATFYLPEKFARSRPVPVPDADRLAIAAVLHAAAAGAPALLDVPLIPREEFERHWPERIIDDGAYRATITVAESYRWLYTGQHRPFHVLVRNDGGETWPGGNERRPLIRLVYRWLHEDGSVPVAEGFRSPFPAPVRPGEEILVPMIVEAPNAPGSYLLEIDAVHEFVRWFGCSMKVEMTIHPMDEAAPWVGTAAPARHAGARSLASGASMNACTIVARNYLAAARVLAESFLDHHPDSSFTVLLLDATEEDKPSEQFEVLSPYEIGIERRELHRMAAIYDVKELATAVKPWLLRTLLTRGSADAVVYFDPDIEIFAPLDDIAHRAREHSIVLIPHYTTPLPADGLLPDDMMFLQAGTYNLGFIAVGRGAERFLDWWSARLARDCVVAIDRGAFVDQRWVDFVPVLFNHTVMNDPTCNVAYWNLHERRLSWTGERYEVDGDPLRFFHFSGFDATKRDLLSAHMASWPRILLSDHPDLARLCREYADKLIDRGHLRQRRLAYRFDSLASGVPVNARIRKLFRDGLEASERGDVPEPTDPFDPAAGEAFLDWLQEPVGPGGLSRYLYSLYLDRVDVQTAYPFVGRLHRDRFLRWAAASGRYEDDIPTALLPSVATRPATLALSQATRARVNVERRLRFAAVKHPMLAKALPWYRALLRSAWYRVLLRIALGLRGRGLPDLVQGREDFSLEIAPDPRPGINVVGYLRAELGIAELARKLVSGIERAGIAFSTITYRQTVSRQQFPLEERDAQRAPYDTNLVCINADQLPIFAVDAGRAFFADRYTIGVWFWELEVFPRAFHGAFDLVDEVWVASEFIREALAPVAPVPLRIVPFPLEAPAAEPLPRASLDLPEAFLFFFSFDFMSITERKNPLGLVAAFRQAFEPGEGPALLIKTINGERKLAALEQLRLAASDRPDVRIIDGYLPPHTEDALMASCDCYVSLHRSEGLGLTMAEAMSYGKPVIATGYSGNLAFMDEENGYLVPYTLAEVPPGCEPYPPGALWAEPDLGRAASLMRDVYENQEEARERGQRARHDIVTRHSLERTATFVARRFAEIHAGVSGGLEQAGHEVRVAVDPR